MNLENYFTTTKGVGVMATSEENGVVDTAIYSRPHVQGTDEVAFIMLDRLTHQNLQTNTHANYLFLEDGHGYNGVRLFLTKLDESTDQELIATLSSRHLSPENDRLRGEKFLVRFKVNKVLKLIGGEEIAID
ncbi:MAG: pyridoxamine 5'-phosphate oxidase family protein [Desulfoarculaceae bacterium]|nr:pyridoxamine 5'-phosphate oxidase family protein [Desulfoarculaceae bacterium]